MLDSLGTYTFFPLMQPGLILEFSTLSIDKNGEYDKANAIVKRSKRHESFRFDTRKWN